jgi:hypothetical protein
LGNYEEEEHRFNNWINGHGFAGRNGYAIILSGANLPHAI